MNKETPNSGIDHDTVVANWNQNAERHDDENYGFLRSMKFLEYGFDPDELAGELHEQAFQLVDCIRCADYCKTLNITFDDEDIERSDGHLNMPTAKFMRRTWKPTMRMARTRLARSRARFSAMMIAIRSMKCGPRSVGSTRTRTRKASHSERGVLPAMHWFAQPCSEL
jgi:hypothetical protein